MPNLLQRFRDTGSLYRPNKGANPTTSNTGMGTNNINNSFINGTYVLYNANAAPASPAGLDWINIAKPRIEDSTGVSYTAPSNQHY